MRNDILLFDQPGAAHTERTLTAARDRALELGIDTVVLATTSGQTALKAAKTFENTGVRVIGVTLQAGTWKKHAPPDPEKIREAEQNGVHILTATHTLMGNVGSAIRDEFGGITPDELIARTYYTFSQGMKVAVEVATMAADAGLLEEQDELVAVAGTGTGADTAIVLSKTYSTDFFDLNISEILAMPRAR